MHRACSTESRAWDVPIIVCVLQTGPAIRHVEQISPPHTLWGQPRFRRNFRPRSKLSLGRNQTGGPG